MRDALRDIEGLKMIQSCEADDGGSVIIALYGSEESATAPQLKVREILVQMVGFMTSQPEIKSGNVISEF